MLARFLDADQPGDVRAAITPLTAARLATNILYRLAPPFLGVIARGLGVSIGTVGVAMSVGELAGLAGPAVGRRVDRAGHRTGMIAGLGMLTAAAAVAAAAPHVAVLAVAFVIVTLGKTTYDAAMASWMGDRVGYSRRGQVVGLTETAWAGALLIGVPVLALAVAATSWRTAFALAGAANLAMIFVLRRTLEPRARTRVRGSSPRPSVRWRPVLPAVAGFALLMTAVQLVIVVFGPWLEDAYGLSTAQIGGVSFLLGAAELAGSVASLRYTDRLGKRRSVLLGAAIMVPSGLALGVVDASVALGILALVVFLAGFEYALISVLPLISELQPDARATMFGMAAGAGTIGRGLAALVGTRLYTAYGMGAPATGAVVCALAAIVVVGALIREPQPVVRHLDP